jgi:hypothetical protein
VERATRFGLANAGVDASARNATMIRGSKIRRDWMGRFTVPFDTPVVLGANEDEAVFYLFVRECQA